MSYPKFTSYIDITDGLYVGTNHPVDSRFVVEQLADLQDIITYAKQYEGLLVWVESEDTYYSYYTGQWHRTPIIYGTAVTGSTAYFDGNNWSLVFPTVGSIPNASLDYATGAHVIYVADGSPSNNVEYVCVGGSSGARVWKATTA